MENNYKIWTSNDNINHFVVNMGDKWILNCIKCLAGKSKTKMYHLTDIEKQNWIIAFQTELKNRHI